MNPVQFAQHECANYEPDGSCLGLGLLDEPAPGPAPRCRLRDGQPCRYFAQCVLPIRNWNIEPPRKKAAYSAYMLYEQGISQGAGPCKLCGSPR